MIFTNIDSTAKIIGNKTYSSGSMGTDKGYTGQSTDSLTGLSYYHARYYDPMVGRFTAADIKQGNAQGMDPYTYVVGNPTTHNDPTGQCPYDEVTGGCYQDHHTIPTPPVPPTPPITPPHTDDDGGGGSQCGGCMAQTIPQKQTVTPEQKEQNARDIATRAGDDFAQLANAFNTIAAFLGAIALISGIILALGVAAIAGVISVSIPLLAPIATALAVQISADILSIAGSLSIEFWSLSAAAAEVSRIFNSETNSILTPSLTTSIIQANATQAALNVYLPGGIIFGINSLLLIRGISSLLLGPASSIATSVVGRSTLLNKIDMYTSAQITALQ